MCSLDNETALTIDGDMLEKVKQVYDKGGVIAITEPSKATMERLKKYGRRPTKSKQK